MVEGPFIGDKPIFVPEDDSFVVRYHIRPKVWFNMGNAILTHDEVVWIELSFLLPPHLSPDLTLDLPHAATSLSFEMLYFWRRLIARVFC